jgi:hypothetical protein
MHRRTYKVTQKIKQSVATRAIRMPCSLFRRLGHASVNRLSVNGDFLQLIKPPLLLSNDCRPVRVNDVQQTSTQAKYDRRAGALAKSLLLSHRELCRVAESRLAWVQELVNRLLAYNFEWFE